MHRPFKSPKTSAGTLLFCSAIVLAGTVFAEDAALPSHTINLQAAPAVIAVQGNLPTLPASVTDLKFGEFFKMPIGPRGLDASAKLLALSGKPVRIVGYMARATPPVAGMFILTPLPVSLGDEDESLSDDLPASSVFVHLDPTSVQTAVPYYPGLLRLTGTLALGPFDEIDGHVSTVRLLIDADLSRFIIDNERPTAIKKHF